MADSTNFALPELGLLRRYLTARGWHRNRLTTRALDVFILAEDGFPDIEIVLPQSSDVADTKIRIDQALRTLSDLEATPPEDVASRISMIDNDIIRARLPDHLVFRESVPLEVARNFLVRARALLIAAASAEIEKSRFVEHNPAASSTYGDRCRFGHTFRGSFGFTIESPVGPNSSPQLTETERPPPFERRVVQRLIRGLDTVQQAMRQQRPELIVESYPTGFNGNMCEELVRLLEKTRAQQVAFQFVLSPEWKPAGDVQEQSQKIILTQDIAILETAAARLKLEDEPAIIRLFGKVIRLESKENPGDLLNAQGAREVRIEWERTSVQVRLSPEDYLKAVEAHKGGLAVSISGTIERTSRGLVLRPSTQLEITRRFNPG